MASGAYEVRAIHSKYNPLLGVLNRAIRPQYLTHQSSLIPLHQLPSETALLAF